MYVTIWQNEESEWSGNDPQIQHRINEIDIICAILMTDFLYLEALNLDEETIPKRSWLNLFLKQHEANGENGLLLQRHSDHIIESFKMFGAGLHIMIWVSSCSFQYFNVLQS